MAKEIAHTVIYWIWQLWFSLSRNSAPTGLYDVRECTHWPASIFYTKPLLINNLNLVISACPMSSVSIQWCQIVNWKYPFSNEITKITSNCHRMYAYIFNLLSFVGIGFDCIWLYDFVDSDAHKLILRTVCLCILCNYNMLLLRVRVWDEMFTEKLHTDENENEKKTFRFVRYNSGGDGDGCCCCCYGVHHKLYAACTSPPGINYFVYGGEYLSSISYLHLYSYTVFNLAFCLWVYAVCCVQYSSHWPFAP